MDCVQSGLRRPHPWKARALTSMVPNMRTLELQIKGRYIPPRATALSSCAGGHHSRGPTARPLGPGAGIDLLGHRGVGAPADVLELPQGQRPQHPQVLAVAALQAAA